MPSLATPQLQTTALPSISSRRWSLRSVSIIVLAWLILQLGGIFSPGLLDDVDSMYIQIAREMMQRHDYVTPYIDGIRFFDKPPLMYWMASASMSIFGVHDYAARLPLALAVLALLLSAYGLGNRLFAAVSPSTAPDRGGFYSALAVATSIGPYLYTRFFIPDILIALWLTLGIHLFLIALERVDSAQGERGAAQRNELPTVGDLRVHSPHLDPSGLVPKDSQPPRLNASPLETEPQATPKSALLPCLAFSAVMALNILTKGLIGAVFPIAFVVLYLALTRRLHLFPRLHLLPGLIVFLLIAAPWHILAAIRNPAIPLPPGLGLPPHAGWAWFYLYNEHIARFLSRRIPHDYGQTPVWLFWLFTALWTMPWAAFLPGALAIHARTLRNRASATIREHEGSLSLLLWSGVILGFFTVSARQEYYGLPAIPALCLMVGGILALADNDVANHRGAGFALRSALAWSKWFLTPLAICVALICGYFVLSPANLAPGTTLSELLANDRALYNLSLGHLSDLTGPAMTFFRRPLAAVTLGMVAIGPASTLLRLKRKNYVANLTLAAGMTITLLAVHTALVRFYPILGSKDLAVHTKRFLKPDDLVIVDSEVTYGSTLIFYTGHQVHVVNGRFNGLWFGSFWPDAPQLFETDDSLRALWSQPRRVFLLTYNAAGRRQDLSRYGHVRTLASAGGKSVLSNR